ncbi:MAG: caspase family protein, partial [Actinomycetospora chiangmaiensis]|nr:caspase family protein [Actinomycetospora chiangmaiensis]
MRHPGISAGCRSRLRALTAAVAAGTRLLVALGLALALKAGGAQAADRVVAPERVIAPERVLAPERRVALVIGNSNYVNFHPSLPNPRNDAEDVSAALRQAGFEVFMGLDLTKRGMEDLMQRFARAANGADAALAYYAGHGLQYQGRNYLVPVDAKIEDEIDIESQTTGVGDVLVGLNRAKGVRIVILDACRNLPLEERANRGIVVDTGLARISGRGLVVAYATQANALAYDGTGRNSLFTDAFLQAMNEPGLDLPQFFQRVSTTVDQNSDRRQTPELSLSYPGQFFFNRTETAAEAWGRMRDSNDPDAYREFIRKYPATDFARAARALLGQVHFQIEFQLRRLGCLREEADTDWGETSIAALRRYERTAGLARFPDQPSQQLLDALRRPPDRFCPTECGRGQHWSGKACMADGPPVPRTTTKGPRPNHAARVGPARARPDAMPRSRTGQATRSSGQTRRVQAAETPGTGQAGPAG